MTHLKFLFLFIFAALGVSACSQNKDMSSKVEAIPHAQLGDNVRPTKYDLDLRIDPRADTFSGTVTMSVNIKNPTRKIWLHGQTITASKASAVLSDGAEIVGRYVEVPIEDAPSGIASLSFDRDIGPGVATLIISYETPYNTALNSAYKVTRKSDGHADNYVVTQFEAIGARQAFPSFDEPRFKVPFDLSITSPKDDVVYANTPEISVMDTSDGWIKHVFSTTRPLPTYLIAFGVGQWDVVDYAALPPTAVRDRAIPFRGITVRGEGKNMEYALKNTAGILEALEAYFGIPYPYEKLDLIAAPDYAFGAMENPGAIVFTEFLLLMSEKSSLGQRRAYASVNAHELAHQWFGDLVTPVWWEDIWLNEAFATWMGNKALNAWKPDGNFDRQTLKGALGAMRIDSLTSTRKIREPLARTENVMDQFDGITYRKGAGVLSMFESYLGVENFQKGVRLHMERFQDDVASADDFFKSLGDGGGDAKVTPALKSFVDQPGLPLVSAKLNCKADVHKLHLSQSRYAPLGSKIMQGQKWQIPVCVRYGADGEVKKSCTLMTKQTAILSLESQSCPDWLSVNADGAGYYRFSLDGNTWSGLLGNVDQLNTREVITVLDSLEASFRAGKMDADTYLDGLSAFAAHPQYDVSQRAGNAIAGLHDTFLSASARPDLARFTQSLYAQRYAAIKGTNSIEADLLAPTLAARLINYGGDSKMRKEFAEEGARYLGLDGKADKKALAPNMRGLGLSQAFIARGMDALPALMELVRAGTPAEKGSAVNALSNTADMKIASKLRKEALNNKDVFTGRQASGLIRGLLGNPDTMDESWTWFKANFDAFVKARVADVRRGGMPKYASSFCSTEKAIEVDAFFKSKAALIPGYERSLAQTLETINLCAALRGAKREPLEAALSAR